MFDRNAPRENSNSTGTEMASEKSAISFVALDYHFQFPFLLILYADTRFIEQPTQLQFNIGSFVDS